MQRQLGNHTNKAWLAGWDAGVIGLRANLYSRRPQADAWEAGRKAGNSSEDEDVRWMKVRAGYCLCGHPDWPGRCPGPAYCPVHGQHDAELEE